MQTKALRSSAKSIDYGSAGNYNTVVDYNALTNMQPQATYFSATSLVNP